MIKNTIILVSAIVSLHFISSSAFAASWIQLPYFMSHELSGLSASFAMMAQRVGDEDGSIGFGKYQLKELSHGESLPRAIKNLIRQDEVPWSSISIGIITDQSEIREAIVAITQGFNYGQQDLDDMQTLLNPLLKIQYAGQIEYTLLTMAANSDVGSCRYLGVFEKSSREFFFQKTCFME